MIITFCGHDDVPDSNKVRQWLCDVLDPFLYEENVVCYFGGYGGFDRLAASVVRQNTGVCTDKKKEGGFIPGTM